jgi:plastocyanin
MRVPVAVLLAGVCGVIGCGGGEKPAAGPGGTATKAPAETGAAPVAGGTQPVTGKTWDVKMLGDANGYRFDPASLTIKRGDGVRWTVISGPPHNVTFWSDSIPPGSSGILQGNMSQTMAPLTGPLLINPSQTYLVSFGGIPPGTYHYYCTPHLALGMKGTIVVQ